MTPEQKQIYRDLEKRENTLQNGGRGDPLVISDTLVDICKTLRILLSSNLVTKEYCVSQHNKINTWGMAKAVTTISITIAFLTFIGKMILN